MPQPTLPPFPIKSVSSLPYQFQEWMRQLNLFITSASGSIPWNNVSKVGANLTDLPIRLHNTLQSIQGGTTNEYYHLTAAQHAAIASLGTFTQGSVIFAGALGVLAQDNTNFFWDDTNNALLLGSTTAVTQGGVIPSLQLHGSSGASTNARIAFDRWVNSVGNVGVFHFGKSRGTTVGSYTAVQSGDALGQFQWDGADGAAFAAAADIQGIVDGTVSSGVVPGSLRLRTATTAGALGTVFIADAAGNLELTAATAATPVTLGSTVAKLQVNGLGTNTGAVSISRFSANAAGPSLNFGKSRVATLNTYTTGLSQNDSLGFISWYGSDSSASRQAGLIEVKASSNWTTSAIGAYMQFGVTTDSSATLAGRAILGPLASNTAAIGFGLGAAVADTSPLLLDAQLHIVSNSNVEAQNAIRLQRHTANATGTFLDFYKARGTTFAAPAAITTGDDQGIIRGYSYVGATGGFVQSTEIKFDTEGTLTDTTNGIGGVITFSTRNAGATLSEGVRLTQNKTFIVNGGLPGSDSVLLGAADTIRAQRQVIGASGSSAADMIGCWSNNTQAPGLYFAKSRGAAATSRTVVASGDSLGNIDWYGADGTFFQVAARIGTVVGGTPGSADMPGDLVFSTTADGSNSVTERARISANGNVAFGINAASAITATLNAATSTAKTLLFQTAGSNRWDIRSGSAAESGSDAGSPLIINAYTDAGAFIDSPITVTRISGGSVSTPRPFVALSTIDLGNASDTTLSRVAAGRIAVESVGIVRGPASATSTGVARYSGTTGDLIQDSGVLIDGSNNVTVPGDLAVNGGDITTSSSSFNLLAGASTINMGSSTPIVNLGSFYTLDIGSSGELSINATSGDRGIAIITSGNGVLNLGTNGSTEWSIQPTTGNFTAGAGKRVDTAASSTTQASIRIPSGTAPTSPVSGEMWYDGTNLKFRDGAVTRTITWV